MLRAFSRPSVTMSGEQLRHDPEAAYAAGNSHIIAFRDVYDLVVGRGGPAMIARAGEQHPVGGTPLGDVVEVLCFDISSWHPDTPTPSSERPRLCRSRRDGG